MQIDSVEIKALAMRITIGQEESLARANFFGFANLVVMPTNATSTVIFASRSMLTMEKTLILMGKSGSSVKNAQSGFIQCVRSKMAIRTYLNC